MPAVDAFRGECAFPAAKPGTILNGRAGMAARPCPVDSPHALW